MQSIALGKFMLEGGGSVDPSRYPDEEFDLYSIPAYDTRTPEVLKGRDIGSNKKVVEPGDVLLSRIVPHIRRAWIVDATNDRRMIASGEWIVFRSDDFHTNYLRNWLLGDVFHQQFMKTVSGVGGSLLRARPSEVAKIKIPFPEINEQKRIAAILDKADSIRGKRKQAIQLVDEFLRSVFLDMFGDPSTNSKGWKRGCIRDLVSEVRYGSSEKAGAVGAYPMLRMNNITYSGGWDFTVLKYIDLSEKDEGKYLVNSGDLLFNRTNSKELVGKAAVYRESNPMAFAGYLIRVSANERADIEYIAAYLNSAHGKTTLRSMCKSIVGMANINAQELQNIAITIPPIDLQRKFAQIVRGVLLLSKVQQTAQDESTALFSSLSQRAFRGEL